MLAMPARPSTAQARLDRLLRIAGVFVGVAVFGGLMALHTAFLIPLPPSYLGSTAPDVIAYRNTVRTLGLVAAILMDLAIGFSVALAFVAGVSRGDVSESMRRGLFLFAPVFLAVWLAFSLIGFQYSRSA